MVCKLQIQRRRRQGFRRWISRFVGEDERGWPARSVWQRGRLSHGRWSDWRRGQQSAVRRAVGQRRHQHSGRHPVLGVHPRTVAPHRALAPAIRAAGTAVRAADAVRVAGPVRAPGAVPARGPLLAPGAEPVPEQCTAASSDRATGLAVATVQRAIARVDVDSTLAVRTIRRAHAAETLRGQAQHYLGQLNNIL